jgi:hypothetical protein
VSYALVIANAIQSEHARLPDSARRLDTGEWVMGLRQYGTVAQQQACGYFAVADVARPADTATHTTDRSLTLAVGVPTVTWTSRPWTPAELASRTAAANLAALTEPVDLEARLDRLAAYNADAEIVAALARANTTAPTTQELNRLLKVMLRRDQRQTAAIALLARVVGNLLDDVADTVDVP